MNDEGEKPHNQKKRKKCQPNKRVKLTARAKGGNASDTIKVKEGGKEEKKKGESRNPELQKEAAPPNRSTN